MIYTANYNGLMQLKPPLKKEKQKAPYITKELYQ